MASLPACNGRDRYSPDILFGAEALIAFVNAVNVGWKIESNERLKRTRKVEIFVEVMKAAGDSHGESNSNDDVY